MAEEERTGRVYFGAALGWMETRVLGRAAVGETAMPGPIVVREFDTTVLVPPDFTVRRDASANLLMRRL